MTSLPSQRGLFDVPDDIAYFNCASYSPQLNESRSRLISGISLKSHPWEIAPSDCFDDTEIIRQLASEALGGDADGYAIIPAASYGLSTAARAIEPQLRKGDRILLIAEEFPSNVLPWKRLARERGADIITVPVPESGNWTQAIAEHMDKSIRVAAVSTCHWTNGAYIDLVAIRQACDQTGSILVVDASQSLGAMPFSFEEIRPDFLIAAGYKWLLSPYGYGLMHVAEQWRDARPLEENWRSLENAGDFSSLASYSAKYLPGARRFDVGEKCAQGILPGAIAALEQIKAWGVQRISGSLSVINRKIASRLQHLGFRFSEESQRCPHMFGAVLPEKYTGDLVAGLKDRNIYVSQRGHSIRFAPHLHINDHDVDRLLGALDELVK